MRQLPLLLAVLALAPLASNARAQAGTVAATTSLAPASGDKETLLKLEQDWGEAVMRHDVAFLERVESENYVYTDAEGRVAHKADDIANAKAGDLKIDSFKLSGMKVQLHGNAAVVTGQTTLAGSDHGGALNGTYRWTDVFIRGAGGNWQVVASQATTVNRPQELVVVPVEASSTPGGTEDPEAD